MMLYGNFSVTERPLKRARVYVTSDTNFQQDYNLRCTPKAVLAWLQDIADTSLVYTRSKHKPSIVP